MDDPVELLAIQADDEVLDDLAFERLDQALDPEGARELAGVAAGFGDDLRVLALLRAWRYDIESEPWPELVSVDQACALLTEAVSGGGVAVRRGRRPARAVTLATAAAVGVFAMSGVGIAAGQARPGDPLWGLSRWFDGDRAASMEAQARVGVALAAARRALAEGHPGEARAVLAGAARDLEQVRDDGAKRELARTAANLVTTAVTTPEGRAVDTDEHGTPSGPRRDRPGERGEPSRAPSQEPSDQRPAASHPGGQPDGPGGEQAADRRDTRSAVAPTAASGRPSQPGSAARRPNPGPQPDAGGTDDDPARRGESEPARPAPDAGPGRPDTSSQRPDANPTPRPTPRPTSTATPNGNSTAGQGSTPEDRTPRPHGR